MAATTAGATMGGGGAGSSATGMGYSPERAGDCQDVPLSPLRGSCGVALGALEAARAAESGTVAGLVPTYLRAEAYMALGDAESAGREYQKILDDRGADPFAPVIPLAYLGLARTAALGGDVPRSRQQFEILLGLWKNADDDLPVLKRARTEYRRLTTAPVPATDRKR